MEMGHAPFESEFLYGLRRNFFSVFPTATFKRALPVFAMAFLTIGLLAISGCATSNKSTTDLSVPTQRNTELTYVWFVLKPTSIWQKNVSSLGGALVEADGVRLGVLKFGERALVGMPRNTRQVEIYVNETYPLTPFIQLSPERKITNLFVAGHEERSVVLTYKTGEYSGNLVGRMSVSIGNRLSPAYADYPVAFVYEARDVKPQ